MSKYQREKGLRWERQVVHDLQEALPGFSVARAFQARDGGAVPDVDGTPYWPECKVGARPQPVAALRQAEAQCPNDRVPIAVCKTDREPATVTMRWTDFLKMISQLHKESTTDGAALGNLSDM